MLAITKKRAIRSLFAAMAVMALGAAHASADCALHRLGQLGGTNSHIAYNNSHAYYDEGPNLVIANVSNPSNPQVRSALYLASAISRIRVVGAYAYVATYEAGLQIVDVADPIHPQILGEYDPGIAISDVRVIGQYAYLATDTALISVNVSNPAAPALASSLPGLIEELGVNGGHLVGLGGFSLRVYSLQNPAVPAAVGTYSAGTSILGLGVGGGYAYINVVGQGMRVISLANPATPTLAGSNGTVYYGQPAVTGGRLYYMSASGVNVATLSNPTAPALLGSWSAGLSFPTELAVSGTTVYVADTLGLRTLNASSPAAITPLATRRVGGYTSDVAIRDGYAYLASDDNFIVIDLSDPLSPQIASTVSLTPWVRAVALGTNHAYAVTEAGTIYVIDISNPAAAFVVTTRSGPISCYGVLTAGARLYAAGAGGLQIYSIVNPASPSLQGSCALHGGAIDSLAVYGNYLYACDYTTKMSIVNVSNAAAPVLLSSPTYPTDVQGVAVSGSHLYMAAGTAGLKVYSLASPAAPALVGSVALPDWTLGVKVVGTRAYVASRTAGVTIVDVTTPAAPVLLDQLDTAGTPAHIAVASGRIATASWSGGFELVATCIKGDINCDGTVNFFDIDPLVLALSGPAAYSAQFPDCDYLTADIDGNGAVDFFDIDPFVGCLQSGGCW